MKKLFILIFSIGLLAFIPKLDATTNLNDNPTGLYKENKFIEEYEKIGYPTFAENKTPSLYKEVQPRYFTSEMSVPAIQQINGYYCGYAAVQEILTYFLGAKNAPTQQQLGQEAGTPDSALYISTMVTLLNNHVNKGYYETFAGNWSLDEFVSKVQLSVQNNKPMVIMAATWPLTMYNGSKNKTHYLVITGYTRSADENWNNRIIYVDSYYIDYGVGSVFGKHVETKEKMWQTFYGDKVNSIVL